jgi:hypothetical protein
MSPPPLLQGRRERRGRRAEAAAAIAVVRKEGQGGRFSRYPEFPGGKLFLLSACVTMKSEFVRPK